MKQWFTWAFSLSSVDLGGSAAAGSESRRAFKRREGGEEKEDSDLGFAWIRIRISAFPLRLWSLRWFRLLPLRSRSRRASSSTKGVDPKLCQMDNSPLVEGQLSALKRMNQSRYWLWWGCIWGGEKGQESELSRLDIPSGPVSPQHDSTHRATQRILTFFSMYRQTIAIPSSSILLSPLTFH